MTRKQNDGKRSRNPGESFAPLHLLEVGRKRAEAVLEAQNELLIAFENLNRDWAIRAKAEAELASNATVKLMGVRSIPHAASVCQEWMSKRMDLWAKDTRWLLDDGQKFVGAGTRLLFNGFNGAPPAAS